MVFPRSILVALVLAASSVARPSYEISNRAIEASRSVEEPISARSIEILAVNGGNTTQHQRRSLHVARKGPIGTAPRNTSEGAGAPASGTNASVNAAAPGFLGQSPSKPLFSKREVDSAGNSFTTCSTVTLDMYNASPFKSTIEDIMKQKYGDKFTVAVNPPDYPDQPLKFCFQSQEADATYDSQPTCTSTQNQLEGYVQNGTADASIEVQQGTSSTHTVSVDKGFTSTVSQSMGFSLKIPEIADIEEKTTVSFSGTFEQGDSTESTVDNQATQTITAHAEHPGTCNIQLNTTQCSAEAKATVPAFYTGYVWFNYEDQHDGHYKWSQSVDSLSPDIRSDNLTVTDKISTQTKGQYTTDCS